MRELKLSKRGRMAGLSTWEAFFFLLLLGGYFFLGISLYEPIWDRWKMMDILETTMEDEDTLRQSKEVIGSRILKRMSVNNIYGVSLKDFKIQKTDKDIRVTFKKVLPATLPFNIDVNVNVNRVFEAKRPLE